MTVNSLPEFGRSLFLEGPFGSGKTTAVGQSLVSWLQYTSPEHMIVFVPQLHTAKPYEAIFTASDVGLLPQITTFSGFARKMLMRFWPLVTETIDGVDPFTEPAFLTMETSQHFMRQIAAPYIDLGAFDSIYLPQSRIIAQILDNMNKAATSGYSLDDALVRLKQAWGDRTTSRLAVYDATIKISRLYREFCLKHNLLDYGMQVDLFNHYLRDTPVFKEYFRQKYRIIVADNIEEMGATAHDFLASHIPSVDRIVIIYDREAGYRSFLGADPEYAYELAGLCEQHIIWDDSDDYGNRDNIYTIGGLFQDLIPTLNSIPENNHLAFLDSIYYVEMLERCVATITHLVHDEQVEPGNIVILTPFLNESLRYSLQYRLQEHNISVHSYRPSRSLNRESVIRALMTCIYLSHPQWDTNTTETDVINALTLIIEDLDPIRAALLTKIVFRDNQLSSFLNINTTVQARIGNEAGNRFETLRLWLLNHTTEDMSLDHYLRRLFGQILSQPGYRFHTDFEASRLAGELINSARQFSQVVHFEEGANWTNAAMSFCSSIESGIIAGQSMDDTNHSVLLMPVFTFLVRNEVVDYQFWLDIGNRSWWERLDQPLTNPYVLRRTFPDNAVWTDEMEENAENIVLRNTILGLLRRCRKTVYVGVSALGESGYESSGPLITLFQQYASLYEVETNDE